MVHACECQGEYARWRVNPDLPVDGATPGQSDTLVVELSCLETWKIHQQFLGAKTGRSNYPLWAQNKKDNLIVFWEAKSG